VIEPPAQAPRRHPSRLVSAATGLGVVVIIAGVVTVTLANHHPSGTGPAAAATRHTRSAAPTPGLAIPAGAVPWADLPSAPPPPPTAYPQSPRPANARPCRAPDLEVTDADMGASPQTPITRIGFRNVSSSPCLLSGFPRVTLTQAGQPSVAGAPTTVSYGQDSAANQPPGTSSYILLITQDSCSAQGAHPSPGSVYHGLSLRLPDGDAVSLRLNAGLIPGTCGVGVTAFSVPASPPVYPPDPLAGLATYVLTPARATAGTVVTYLVRLTNPGATTVPLEPCPTFMQYGPPGLKDFSLVNCALAHPIPAHDSEDFVMRMLLPVASVGMTPVCWDLVDESLPGPSNCAPIDVSSS
jgi:hypothetical protein